MERPASTHPSAAYAKSEDLTPPPLLQTDLRESNEADGSIQDGETWEKGRRGHVACGNCARSPWSGIVGLAAAYVLSISGSSSDGVNPIWWRSEGGGVMSRRIASNTARNWRS